jgi:hypothetical protein
VRILDGGTNTCVLGQGYKVISIKSTRRPNVVGFDYDAAVEIDLPIVSASLQLTFQMDRL